MVFSGFVLTTTPAFAFQQELNQQTQAFAGSKGADFGEGKDPRIVITQIINVVLTLVGVLFLGYTIYAGYMILSSGGEEEKINKGKSTLRYAVIGVIVTLSAYSILYFVTRQLGWATQDTSDGIFFRSNSEAYNVCIQGGGDPVSCQR